MACRENSEIYPRRVIKTKVLYHANCPDGFAAAYCAWSVLGDSAVYISVEYQQPPPPIERGDHVFIVDFSYPRDVLLEMQDRASEITVLDHHKTAKEQLLELILPFSTWINPGRCWPGNIGTRQNQRPT